MEKNTVLQFTRLSKPKEKEKQTLLRKFLHWGVPNFLHDL